MILILIFNIILSALEPSFNGSFYPKTEKEINDLISKIFEQTPQNKNLSKAIAAIVPHAGYIYSASIAANVYKSIPQSDIYFIISPSHKHWFDDAILCNDTFKTPLGNVETDQEIVKKLIYSSENKLFINDCQKFIGEHAIEIQLPFLQHRFKNQFKIIPILINTTNYEKIKRMAQTIKNIMNLENKKTFYIISSDLSHYPEYEKAKTLDLTFIEAIKRMDIFYLDLTSKILLSKGIENYQTSACGLSAILLGIEISKQYGYHSFEMIQYKNSYDTNPVFADKKSVVGYTASIFTNNKINYEQELSNEEHKILLTFARKSIEDALENKGLNLNEIYQNIKFNMPQAVFVTLTQNGNLRGCMGTTEPRLILGDAVKYFARIAAFNDPRFSPLKKDEIKKTKIEISILSPLTKIKDYTLIKEKKDGVVIASKKGSGLFLPQVWEYFSTKEEFLSELCSQKAGLPSDCWKSNDTEIFIFNVEKFSE